MARSVIDPVTRIEGHLRIEMEVTDGVVEDAWVSGTLFRGMELVLKNRTPTDAFFISQRICGVCPVSHGHTSSMAAEAALGVTIPNGARIVRNLVEGAQFLHSHILWFYNLAGLDWVNPANALNADIANTYALAQAAGTGITDFGKVQQKVQALVDSGQMSIFTNAWFDSPDYNLPPELDLIGTAHYLEALEMQAEASTVAGILGGKMPHIMTSIPGGTAWMPTEEKLDDVLFRLTRIHEWVLGTMIPDTLAIAPYYTDTLGFGQGVGNFLAWGVFDRESREPNDRYLPAGIVSGGLTVADVDDQAITEQVGRSFYEQYEGGLHPSEGITEPSFPDGGYDLNGQYTWSKAPRYDGQPMEVGGLSRLIVGYLRGVPRIKELIDSTLTALGAAGKPEVLISTLGRTAGRNLETLYVSELMLEWITELVAAVKEGGVEFFTPLEAENGAGTGMWEAPRGALLHYMDVKGGLIDHYQAIVPSTWNVSPRDDQDVRGPMEQALIGVPVGDLEKPLQALRTVHSFDPCIACAVHVIDSKKGRTFKTFTSPARHVGVK